MTSLAKGSGKQYQTALDKLGVSTIDANGKTKSLSAVYSEIIASLSKVTDETERASLASILFGENGLNVANVAALSTSQINAYNQELINNGIISSEAAQAGLVADQIDNVKQQLSAVAGELLVALMPLIMDLIEILQTTVIPILSAIAGWFASMSPEQQKLVLFILVLIIILPNIISIVTAVVGVIKAITIASYGAAGGVGAVSTASAPLQPILLAVAAAILVVVILFAMLAGKSQDVTSELKSQQAQFSSMQSTYDGMAADMDVTTGVVSSNTNSSYVEHNVRITAEGDTPVYQETADMVADNLADKINASLGGKI